MNESHIDGVDLVGDSYLHFNRGYMIYGDHISVNHIDAGDLLYGAWEMKDTLLLMSINFMGIL